MSWHSTPAQEDLLTQQDIASRHNVTRREILGQASLPREKLHDQKDHKSRHIVTRRLEWEYSQRYAKAERAKALTQGC